MVVGLLRDKGKGIKDKRRKAVLVGVEEVSTIAAPAKKSPDFVEDCRIYGKKLTQAFS